MTKSSGTKGVLGFIGGILALVSLWMAWFQASLLTASGFGTIDIGIVDYTATNLRNAGYLILLGATLALLFGILMIADVIKYSSHKTGYAIILIGGVLCVVGLIVWLLSAAEVDAGWFHYNLYELDNLTVEIGFFLAIAGTLLIILDGLLGVKKR